MKRRMSAISLGGFAALSIVVAIAGSPLPSSSQESPYIGLEQRPLKALSEQQIDDYLEGRGMGLALAAELNGYPGPKHVLELGEMLGLDEAQRAAMQGIFDRMHERAVTLGREIVEREQALDALFAEEAIDLAGLERATEELGRLNGRLRGVHLAAHLETVEVLRPDQREHYFKARGYHGDGEMVHDPSRHHG